MTRAVKYIFLIGIILFPLSAYPGGNTLKAPYSLKNLREHPGSVYSLPEKIQNIGLADLFAIPVHNAVGTNAMHNAITSISFNGKSPKFDVIRQDFLKYVSGGDLSFLEQFSNSIIAYAQSRRFVVFDVHTGKFRTYIIAPGIKQGITKVALYDAPNVLFIFDIEEFDKDSPVPIADYTLAKIDARAELVDKDIQIILPNEPERLKAHYLLEKKVETRKKQWLIHNKQIFIYYGNTIEVLDSDFKTSTHPLQSAFKNIQDYVGDIKNLLIHPTLPLAILIDRQSKLNGKYNVWAILWDEKGAHQSYLLFDKYTTKNPTFSPDGQWLLYSISGSLYAAAVDPLLQQHIGPPIKLGSPSAISGYAWIHEPQAFVVSTGYELYRWDISNAAIKAKHVYK